MKKHTIRFRAVDKNNFDEIKNGSKSVETRAATEKYQKIKSGDSFVIVCGKSRMNKTIKRARHFRTISALIKTVGLKKVMPDVSTIEEAKRRWNSYPGYKEKIKQHGLMAFELE
jgi:ASC-1-like (ASCH) protein